MDQILYCSLSEFISVFPVLKLASVLLNIYNLQDIIRIL